jgi:hypothetical protein
MKHLALFSLTLAILALILAIFAFILARSSHAELSSLPGTTFYFPKPPPSFKRYTHELRYYHRCNGAILFQTCRRWGK